MSMIRDAAVETLRYLEKLGDPAHARLVDRLRSALGGEPIRYRLTFEGLPFTVEASAFLASSGRVRIERAWDLYLSSPHALGRALREARGAMTVEEIATSSGTVRRSATLRWERAVALPLATTPSGSPVEAFVLEGCAFSG